MGKKENIRNLKRPHFVKPDNKQNDVNAEVRMLFSYYLNLIHL